MTIIGPVGFGFQKGRPGIAMAESDTPEKNGWKLLCPVCGSEYSRVRSVATLDPDAGDYLVITLDGECGHVWEIRMRQDEGINYVVTGIVKYEVRPS